MPHRYISKEGLANLATYKYQGIDNSILARLFLNDFWNWVVERLPKWLAPNLITLSGFLLILANYFAIAYYCPTLTNCSIPAWVFVSSAVCIMVYQTLDNVDGKQARRTKSSSALGELFDHGCDSLFVTIAGMALPAAFGASPWFGFIMLHVGYLTFYYAHWEEYHTGILILGPLANPTEMECLMSAVLLFTAFVGTGFWATPLSHFLPSSLAGALPAVVANSPLNEALVAGCFVIVFSLLFFSAQTVLNAAKAKHIPTLEACEPLLPLTIHMAASTLWFYFSPSRLLHTYPLAVYTFYGVVVSYLLIKLILARIVKVQFHPWDPVVLLPVAGAYYALFIRHAAALSEMQLFVGLFVIAIAMHLHMSVSVVRQLTAHLKIRAFTIPYPRE